MISFATLKETREKQEVKDREREREVLAWLINQHNSAANQQVKSTSCSQDWVKTIKDCIRDAADLLAYLGMDATTYVTINSIRQQLEERDWETEEEVRGGEV